MLQIKNVCKRYKTGDLVQTALDEVSLNLRDNEFVAILGPSGSGKTTLLNVIGGLDRYDSGDLIINGISTEKYRDRDWDSYRNHTIGFVFQSYNLIPHQSILANVELALTISGIKRSQRRARAKQALEKVGLGDQLHKRPNQLSGGQMQRVAIARALVNNPDILLADEPTGALDTQTSVQVMELLKEVAKDRLVVMVTHNPELAQQYATRTVNLRDGQIVDDSQPFEVEQKPDEKPKHKNMGKASMSLMTALSLSFNNLRTKMGRTILTSFAGSIGIIGIALILSLSSGVNAYINETEASTLSNYPITIDRQSIDYTSMMMSRGTGAKDADEHDEKRAYTQNYLLDQITSLDSYTKTNDLKAFREYIEKNRNEFGKYTQDISYSYDTTLYVYNYDDKNKIVKANPNTLTEDSGLNSYLAEKLDSYASQYAKATDSDIFTEIFDEEKLQNSYYKLLRGEMPQKYDEVVLILDKNNQITDYSLYTLGLLDRSQIKDYMDAGENAESKNKNYEYSELIGQSFRVLAASDLYEKSENGYADKSEDSAYMKTKLAKATEIKIVGIAKYTDDASSVMGNVIGGMVGYLPSLSEYIMDKNNDSEIVKAQQADKKTDVFTGMKFKTDSDIEDEVKNFNLATVPAQYQGFFAGLEGDELQNAIKSYITMATPKTTYDDNLKTLGVASIDNPSQISIYCTDFEAKEKLTALIDDYNEKNGEDKEISYTDYVGLMMSSITTIINAISYILIAFVAISLIVSSIMIGIITYISVLERTKEIGILRAIGASKRNISQVFNAETFFIGLFAGIIGIGMTLLLILPINAIIHAVAGTAEMNASLPVVGGIVLVVLSVLLTLIGGLIPSKKAAKKDPVTALRTE